MKRKIKGKGKAQKMPQKMTEKQAKNQSKKHIFNGYLIVLTAILLLVFLAGIYLMSAENDSAAESQSWFNASVVVNYSAGKTMSECLAQIGISENLVYIYSDTCVYSQRNTPWIREINPEKGVRMINIENAEQLIKFMNCMPKFELEGTPTYICIPNSKVHVGSFDSKSELMLFAENCR
ncbi:MAG: hypothetical protein N3G74_01665 [Candidatus Micrarchaeota archaeon]|nr:hypothetical protein [Candidatus Micrarchaeota archaeon]